MPPNNAEGKDFTRLLTGLRSKDTRLVCAMALCASGEAQFIQPVAAIMDKLVWDEVDDLAHSLRNFGHVAVPFLVPVASSNRKASAACAMRALGLIGGKEAIKTLTERLITLPSKSEPTEALVTMEEAAVPSLLSLTDHSKADIRAMAVFALGKIGDKAVLEHLEAIARGDRSEKVQYVANLASSWLRGESSCDTDLRNVFGELPTN